MTLARSGVLVLAAGHMLAMVDRNLLAVAATPVARGLDLHDGMLGVVLGTAVAAPYAAAAVLLGGLSDRGYARALLVGGAVLWTMASLLTGLVHNPTELIAARMLLGVGQAAFVPAALVLLVGEGDTAGRARHLSLFTSGSTIGRSLALLGGGAILAALTVTAGPASWRWLFVITAMPNLMLVAALLVLAPHPAPAVHASRDRRGVVVPRLLLFLLAACMPIVAGQAAVAWMPTLFVRLYGLSPAAAGVLVGAIALVAAPTGQLLGGWLARHWLVMRERPLLSVAVGLWLTLLPLMLIASARSTAIAAIGVAGINLALGVASFAAIFGWQGLLPAGKRGLGNGAFMATVTLVGVGAGPLVTGLLSEAAGGGGAALGRALIATCIGAAALATIVAVLPSRGRSEVATA